MDGSLDGVVVLWRGAWNGLRGHELIGAGSVAFKDASIIGPRLPDSGYQNASELFAVVAGICYIIMEIPIVQKVHLVSNSTTVLGWIKSK